jgi:hypothetical protein
MPDDVSSLTSGNPAEEILLDVSDMEPPDPLVLTLEAAEQLQPGQYVRMLHRREPCLLYPDLKDHNFSYYQREGLLAAVEVFIWRKDDNAAALAVSAIVGKLE